MLAFAALTFLAADPAAAQKRSLVVANATADAGKLDPHLTAVGARQEACPVGCSVRAGAQTLERPAQLLVPLSTAPTICRSLAQTGQTGTNHSSPSGCAGFASVGPLPPKW